MLDWLQDAPDGRQSLESLLSAARPEIERAKLRAQLLGVLGLIRQMDQGRREVRRALKTKRREPLFNTQLAAACTTLNEFAAAIADLYQSPAVLFLPPVAPLREALGTCAVSLLRLQRLLTGQRPLQDVLIALLINRVVDATGKPHDRDVSTLVTAALASGDGQYWSAEALKMWRTRKNKLISEVGRVRRATVRQARAQRAAALRSLFALADRSEPFA